MLCRHLLYIVGATDLLLSQHQLLHSYNPPSSSYGSSAYNVGGNGYYSGGSNQILYPGYVDDVQLLIRKAPPSIRIKESDVLDVA